MTRGKSTPGEGLDPIGEQSSEVRKMIREFADTAIQLVVSGQETAAEAVGLADRGATVAEEAMRLVRYYQERLATLPHSEVLTRVELERFAAAYPQWTMTAGFANGEAVKTYRRIIGHDELPVERRGGGTKERETYLRLADPEHSDIGLGEILGAYYDSECINGTRYVITAHPNDDGVLTLGDIGRIVAAEDYLIAEGYIQNQYEAQAA